MMREFFEDGLYNAREFQWYNDTAEDLKKVDLFRLWCYTMRKSDELDSNLIKKK